LTEEIKKLFEDNEEKHCENLGKETVKWESAFKSMKEINEYELKKK
jgi:hypothetical protein